MYRHTYLKCNLVNYETPNGFMCNENDFRIVKQICVVNVHPLFKFNGEKKDLHNILNFYVIKLLKAQIVTIYFKKYVLH